MALQQVRFAQAVRDAIAGSDFPKADFAGRLCFLNIARSVEDSVVAKVERGSSPEEFEARLVERIPPEAAGTGREEFIHQFLESYAAETVRGKKNYLRRRARSDWNDGVRDLRIARYGFIISPGRSLGDAQMRADVLSGGGGAGAHRPSGRAIRTLFARAFGSLERWSRPGRRSCARCHRAGQSAPGGRAAWATP